MYKFSNAPHTQSGNEFNFVVSPIWTPPSFQLSKTLERALAFENDETCINIDDYAPHSQASNYAPKRIAESNVNNLFRTERHIGTDQTKGAPEDVELEDGEIREEIQYCKSEDKGMIELEDGELEDHDALECARSSNARHRKRRYRQLQKSKKFEHLGHSPRLADKVKHIGRAVHIDFDIKLPELPFARCGFQGTNKGIDSKDRVVCLDELKAQGYKVIEHVPGVSHPIVDSITGKVFGVAVGTMDDPTYGVSTKEAFEFLKQASTDVDFDESETNHRRGRFTAVNYGVSYGQGSQVPHWLHCKHEQLMQKVFSNDHIKRLGTFASYLFSMWAPNVFNYYHQQIALLHGKMPSLKWTFYNTIWLCATINFGPNVCCLPHRDFLNLPFGWCAIIALGEFDHKKGGHLVLHDLKIVIEFPPGSVILIPSALLTHSNTPIQPGESRMSFTQFCAGGIFRYIENGFRSEKKLQKTDKKKFAEMQQAKTRRRDIGIGMWSTIDELLTPLVT